MNRNLEILRHLSDFVTAAPGVDYKHWQEEEVIAFFAVDGEDHNITREEEAFWLDLLGLNKNAPILVFNRIARWLGTEHNELNAMEKIEEYCDEKLTITQLGALGLFLDAPMEFTKSNELKNPDVVYIRIYEDIYGRPVPKQKSS